MGLLASPLAARAQPAARVARVGYVTSSSRSVNVDAFDQGLRELGYTIGQDIIEEYRFGEGQPSAMPALVAELLPLKTLFTLPISAKTAKTPGLRTALSLLSCAHRIVQ
jgi:hypothetical protein